MKSEITKELFSIRDEDYAEFMRKLIPTVEPDTVIGIRTPELKAYAKRLAKEKKSEKFLKELPHKYFEENQLHAFLLSDMKDYEACAEAVGEFLPFVDNWATCDQLTPKVFAKHKEELLKLIDRWLKSGETYTVRFAVKMLMSHFLDDGFDLKYPKKVASIRSDEYYVQMMVAWYYATALAKQYDAVLPFIEKRCLDKWTHNKAIQKAAESYRVSDEHKEYLKTLKIK